MALNNCLIEKMLNFNRGPGEQHTNIKTRENGSESRMLQEQRRQRARVREREGEGA